MSGSAGALVTTDKFEELEHAIVACRAAGARVVKRLEVDVSTLDDDDTKRARLAGALLVTKAGQRIAVPHTNHYWRNRLRAHPGAFVSGTTTFSPEELLDKVESA